MHRQKLRNQFVAHIPDELQEGVLYNSMEYGTLAHRCCCGCGEEVDTPLSPSGWQITFDGEAVSLWPSVGSWSLPCRSHYIIRKNIAVSAENGQTNAVVHAPHAPRASTKAVAPARREAAKPGMFARFWMWLRR